MGSKVDKLQFVGIGLHSKNVHFPGSSSLKTHAEIRSGKETGTTTVGRGGSICEKHIDPL